VERIKSRTDALQQAFHGVSERMYQQAAQAQEQSGNGAQTTDGASQDEEVVDAEVVDEGNK
jgi:molecular chaperone DnaK